MVKVDTSLGNNGSGFGGGWIKGILQQKAGGALGGIFGGGEGGESTGGGGQGSYLSEGKMDLGGSPQQSMDLQNNSSQLGSYSQPQQDYFGSMYRKMGSR